MGGGSAPTSGGSAARKAGGTGSGTDKTSAGEQKVPQPKHRHPTGLAHSLTARQAPQQPERKLLDRSRRSPHAREESSARATGMGGGRTSVSDTSGKSAGGGAGMSDSDASNTSAQ